MGPRSEPASDMPTLACALLRCPRCQGDLAPAGSALRCPARHTFDIARHGYISLLGGARARSGDDPEMARARERFLGSGAYEPVREAVTGLAVYDLAAPGQQREPVVLDIGAGTGYYLAGVLEKLPEARGIALDTSVRSLREAARSHPRAVAAIWDAFEPFPIADADVDVVLDVFAPRNPPEFARVLRPDGRLVVARPTPGHLAELRQEVAGMVGIDPAKEERLARALDPWFTPESTTHVDYRVALDEQQARDLVAMTPSARHVDLEAVAGQAGAGLEVTVSVLVTAYRARPRT